MDYQEYKKARAWASGWPVKAQDVLRYARATARVDAALQELDPHDLSMVCGMFTIQVRIDYDTSDGWEYDEAGGGWTNEYTPGCLINRDYNKTSSSWYTTGCQRYHYTPSLDGARLYYRAQGMARQQAYETERAQRYAAMWDMEKDVTCWFVTATAWRMGVELGSDSCGGIQADSARDPYVREILADVIDGALIAARAKLAQLVASV